MAEELVLGVDFDLSAVEKAIDDMQKKFDSYTKELDKIPSVLSEVDSKIEEINQKETSGIQLTQQEVMLRDALVNRSVVLSQRMTELNERAAMLGCELENARLDPEAFAKANGYIESADKDAKNLKQDLEDSSRGADSLREKTEATGENIERSSGGLSKFASHIGSLIKNAFVFNTISKGLRSIRDGLNNAIQSNERFSETLSWTKGNLSVAFQPIIDIATPYIEKLLGLLEKASQYISAFLHTLTGSDVKKSIESAKKLHDALSGNTDEDKKISQIDAKIKALNKDSKELDKSSKALKAKYEADKAVYENQEKALKKQIDSAEDYMNTLKKMEKEDQKSVEAKREVVANQIAVLDQQRKNREQELKEQRKAVSAQISETDRQIKALRKQREAREKELQANKGTLAGFDTMQILSGAGEEDEELAKINAEIEALEDKKDALDAVKDSIPNSDNDPILQQINAQIEALQAQKDAIEGVDYSEMISEQQTYIDSLQNQLSGLNELSDKLQEDYSVNLSINEEAKEKIRDQIEALNEERDAIEEIKTSNEQAKNEFKTSADEIEKSAFMETIVSRLKEIREWWDKNSDSIIKFLKIAGGIAIIATTIFGVITAVKNLKSILGFFTGPAGIITLIAVGIAAIVTLAGNADEMIENLQLILGGFKDFITGVFMGDTELAVNGLKKMAVGLGNCIIIVLESIVNLGAKALNWIVDKLRKFSIDPPEWIKKITGWEGSDNGWFSNFEGFDENWKIPFRLEVPALAQGAVIPGGKSWLAILGDQPAGQTNIEAPASLIGEEAEAAIRRVLDEQDIAAKDITVHVSFEGTEAQFVRRLLPKIEVEQRRRSAFYA